MGELDGLDRAVQVLLPEIQKFEQFRKVGSEVIGLHPKSHLRMRHRLSLAEQYDQLVTEYLEVNPPGTLRFQRSDFEGLANMARRLYLEIALADGFPEKLVARARLEAVNLSVEETLRYVP